jgi:transcriptional regulator with XRE-family HTH domain
MNHLPQRLHTWRTAAGLSREQAAARLGVTASTLFRWEHGLVLPKGLSKVVLERELAGTPATTTTVESNGGQS